MNIQPTSGSLRLRVGEGYLDQAQIAQEIVNLWTSPELDPTRNAACLVFDVGTGKTCTALRVLFSLKEALRQKQDERWKLPSLIVCRDKARWQWVKEIQDWIPEWTAKETLMLEGDKKNVEMWLDVWRLVGNPSVVIMNYDKLTDYNEALRKNGPYLAIILDEIHAIAYASTQRNQSADALDCSYRIGLTGTVVRREPDSMHGILNWLQPGSYKSNLVGAESPKPDKGCRYREDGQTGFLNYYLSQSCERCELYVREDKAKGICAWSTNELVGKEPTEHFYHLYSPVWGSYDKFRNRYCRIGCNCGAVINDMGVWEGGERCCYHRYKKVIGSKNEAELKDRLYDETKLFWRLDAKSIPGFPEVFPRRVDCPLTKKQSALYREAERGLIRYLDDKGEWGAKSTLNILSQIAWLRSIVSLPPSIVLEKLRGAKQYPEWMEGIGVPEDNVGGKQDFIEGYFEDYVEKGDKVVLFSEWVFCTSDYHRRIQDILKSRGEFAIHIHGGMRDFEQAKLDFNTDPRCTVAICSPAGSESLNLHQGLIGTDGRMHVIHSDCAWTPAEIKQRTGRVQRFGGKNAIANFCTAILDDGQETVDSRMIARVMQRASVSDMITGSGLGELFDFGNKTDVMSLLGVR